MCAFSSPGILSKVVIVTILSDIRYEREAATDPDNGELSRMGALSVAPCWLAAESVLSSPWLPPRSALTVQSPCRTESR